MSPEIFLASWVSEWWIFVFNVTPFDSYYFYPIFTCVDPDSYRNGDMDPQSS